MTPGPPAPGQGPRPRLDRATAEIRNALRRTLITLPEFSDPLQWQDPDEQKRHAGVGDGLAAPVLLAVSGGADSLALASAAAFLHRGGEARLLACTVDHGLQEGSAEVAQRTVDVLGGLGLPAVSVRLPGLPEGTEGDGIEARARHGRYAALARAARAHGCRGEGHGRGVEQIPFVLTAHTLDDQAESVLLGLMRGSGARSLSGMAPTARLATGAGPVRVLRPLLSLTRAQTRASCEAQGLAVWDDPMNEDPGFARVRARQLLGRLETELGQGLRANLARTADLLRDDADHLEAQSAEALANLRRSGGSGQSAEEGHVAPPGRLDAAAVAGLPAAVRSRVLRRWLVEAGVSAQELTAEHVRRVGELAASATGASASARSGRRVSVPGASEARVRAGWLELRAVD